MNGLHLLAFTTFVQETAISARLSFLTDLPVYPYAYVTLHQFLNDRQYCCRTVFPIIVYLNTVPIHTKAQA